MSPSVPFGTLDVKKLILMSGKRTVVFFDAGYLSKLSKYFGKGKYLKLDLVKFAEHLSNKQGLVCEQNITLKDFHKFSLEEAHLLQY